MTPRFRLSTLFVLVSLIALGLGWVSYRSYLYHRQFVEAEVTKVGPKTPGIFLDDIVRYKRVSRGVLTVVRRVEDTAGTLHGEETVLTRELDSTSAATLTLRYRLSRGRLEVIEIQPDRTRGLVDLTPQYDLKNNQIHGSTSVRLHRLRRGDEYEVARLQLFRGAVDQHDRPIRDLYRVYLRLE
jgi:hypothetical protein